MTLWRNLVVALVAAFALAACNGSSDSGPSQAELDAANERADAAEERAEAAEEAQEQAESGQEAAENERDAAQDQLDAIEDKEAAEAAKEAAAMARELALAFDEVFVATPTITAERGEAAKVTAATLSVDGTEVTGDDVFSTTADPRSGMLEAMYGWSGTEVVVKSGMNTDTVRVYTNIDAPTPVKFSERFNLTDGALAISGTNGFMSFPGMASGAGVQPHEHNTDNDGTPGNDTFVIGGTYAGAAGTFRCTGTCTTTVGSGGTTVGGTWHFTPNSGAMAMDADANYQNFGWWLRKTDTGYMLDSFAGSTPGETAHNATPLNGTATYQGPAVGKYALYSSGWQAGHFEAKATLKADFTNNMISGTVDSFGGEGMDDWSVELQKTEITSTGFSTAEDTNAATAWAIGEDTETAAGMWQGAFYSPHSTSTVPQAAVGTFSAEYGSVGDIVGAFGVEHSGD